MYSRKSNRTIIPRTQSQNPGPIQLCTEQDPTMFKDPAYVREWMATATNGSPNYQEVTSHLPLMGQAMLGESYSGYYAPESHRLPLNVSSAGYDTYLYATDHPAVVAPANLYIHSDSVSSEDGSIRDFQYDVPGSAAMEHTMSNQSAAFTNYSGPAHPNGTKGHFAQSSFSTSTSWSSPSSTAMEPPFATSYTASGFFPSMVSTSEDFRSYFPGQDDVLPASMLDSQVQSPTDFYSSDSVYTSTIRPSRDQARGSIVDTSLWQSAELPQDMIAPTNDFAHGSSHIGKQCSPNANPRDHHLYHVEANRSDKLYYCPFGATEGCKHRPDKLKCNYDKHLDSHLKPYRCKYNACSSVPFSSTACLLRHEREAHGMHGHGSNPFRCHYPECDRGRGFPRRYNLEDHMKRMHGYEPSPNNRRKSPGESDTGKTATARPAKRRSTNASSSTPSDQVSSRAGKHQSTRASGSSRRRSVQ